MNRKVSFCLLTICFLTSVSLVRAQTPAKIPRVGILVPGSSKSGRSTLGVRNALRDLGYVEGKNIAVVYRYAGGNLDRIPELIHELVQAKVDVLFVTNFVAVRAAKQTTKTIPVVMVISVDPVATGIVDSLARPGGNITGLSVLTREISGKRLELFKEIFPGKSRAAILWDTEGPGPAVAFKEYQDTAQVLKLQLLSLGVRGPKPDIKGAIDAAKKGRADALIIVSNPLIARVHNSIINLALENRLASLCETSRWVDDGALASYSANELDRWKRAAIYIDKILKGVKPADLPIEQPTKFDFVVNLKTANELGITIPQWTLMKADRVIK